MGINIKTTTTNADGNEDGKYYGYEVGEDGSQYIPHEHMHETPMLPVKHDFHVI